MGNNFFDENSSSSTKKRYEMCKHCGSYGEIVNGMCSYCGNEVVEKAQIVNTNSAKNYVRCKKCSSIINEDIDICPSCGTKLFETREEKVKMFFLTWFLGGFGVHKFLRGENKLGKIYLCTFGLFGLGWIYDTFYSLIDMICSYATTDAQRRSTFYDKKIRSICSKVSLLFCVIGIIGVIFSPSEEDIKNSTNDEYNVAQSNISSSNKNNTYIENEEPNPVASKEKEENKQIVASLTATQLINTFKNNVLSAESNYKNKYIKVSGTIGSIDKTILGDEAIIRLETGEYLEYVCCYFTDENEINKIKNYGEGYEIVLSGKCTSSSDFLGDTVYMHDCKVISSTARTPKDKFTLASSTGQNGYYTYNITGTIKNNTSATYSFVKVTFNLYDSRGNLVGSASDSISNFDANGTWRFNASAWNESNKNIASYKLVEIKNY